MRVTNGMIRNTTLNGLYNNMNALNKTYAQMVTGKKIQTVSDDPIIAGRALKLKSTVLETDQYQKNVKEAASWMEVTEAALDNITEILKNIRTKCVQASTGTLDKDDREAIRVDIEQLWKQLHEEANASYGGRYVFSGYKTKDPLFLKETFEIKGKDLQVKQDMIIGSDTPVAENSVLKGGSQIASGSVLGKGTEVKEEFTLGANTVLSKEDTEALLGIKLENGKYFFDAPKTLKAGTEVTVEQAEALIQELGATITIPPNLQGQDKFALPSDIKVGGDKTKGLRNDVAKALFGVEGSDTSYTTTVEHKNPNGTGYTFKGDVTIGAGSKFEGDITTKGDTVLAGNSVVEKDSVLKQGTKLGKGTLNPNVVGNINGHSIEYEVGTNSTIAVNVQGMDGIMGDIAICLNEIFLTLDSALNGDTINTEDLHKMFTNKLDELDKIISNVSESTSDLGSRMGRLEYTETRLTDKKVTFQNLLSVTEDIDIEETYTNFNVQFATYQSALQATSKIITNTLADYL